MALYVVRNKMHDFINGILLRRGEHIETNDDLWVARFGDTLKPVGFLPKDAVAIPIMNTEEGSSQIQEQIVEEKLEPKKEDAKTRSVFKAPVDKVVDANETKKK